MQTGYKLSNKDVYSRSMDQAMSWQMKKNLSSMRASEEFHIGIDCARPPKKNTKMTCDGHFTAYSVCAQTDMLYVSVCAQRAQNAFQALGHFCKKTEICSGLGKI